MDSSELPFGPLFYPGPNFWAWLSHAEEWMPYVFIGAMGGAMVAATILLERLNVCDHDVVPRSEAARRESAPAEGPAEGSAGPSAGSSAGPSAGPSGGSSAESSPPASPAVTRLQARRNKAPSPAWNLRVMPSTQFLFVPGGRIHSTVKCRGRTALPVMNLKLDYEKLTALAAGIDPAAAEKMGFPGELLDQFWRETDDLSLCRHCWKVDRS